MHNKILHRFFSNNKALLSRTRTSFANLQVRIIKKKANFLLLFKYGYMRSNLARLGEYPTHWDVADMSNLFYFYFGFVWSSEMIRLPSSRLSKRNGLNKNRCKREKEIIQMRMYQFKLPNSTKELNLFLWRGYEHVFSLTRWNKLYINKKIYYPAYQARPPVGIFFRYKYRARK